MQIGVCFWPCPMGRWNPGEGRGRAQGGEARVWRSSTPTGRLRLDVIGGGSAKYGSGLGSAEVLRSGVPIIHPADAGTAKLWAVGLWGISISPAPTPPRIRRSHLGIYPGL